MTWLDLRPSPSGRPRGMTSTEPRVVPTHRQGLGTVSANISVFTSDTILAVRTVIGSGDTLNERTRGLCRNYAMKNHDII